MAQSAGRISCPRCGANNFDTVSVCWKCQLPLQGSAGSGQSGQSGQNAMPGLGAPAMSAHYAERNPQAMFAQTPAYVSSGDAGVARRAAIALGLTIPFIGLPIGWVFMMIEDERRQAIGRVCAVWSMIGLVLHLLLTIGALRSAEPMIQAMVNTAIKSAAQNQNGGQSGLGIPDH